MSNDIIVSSRIRLARNLAYKPFSNNTSLEIGDNVLNCVFNALSDISNFNFYRCKNYFIYQIGDTLKGSCRANARDKIDLANNKVVSYDIKRDYFTLNNGKKTSLNVILPI